ncbi:unnamed protein product [Rhizopus stolonifer]
MVDVALDTIHQVVSTLGTGISIANIRDPVERSIDNLLNQCIERIKNPELKHARSAAFILRAVASASDPACTSVTHAVLPIIYQHYKPTDPPARQGAILDILMELLIASKQLYGSVEDVGYDRDFQTPLLMYKQQILQIFVLCLIDSEPSLRIKSLEGIHEMVLMKQFLNKEEVHVTVNHLTRQLEKDKQIRDLCLKTLCVITKLHLESIVKYTVPVLLKELADQEHCVGKYSQALEAIEVLAVQSNLFKVMIDSLLIKLDYACTYLGKDNPIYCQELISCILTIYRATCKETQIGYTILLPFILRGCVSSVLEKRWDLNSDLIDKFAMILALTMRSLNLNDQQLLVENACRLFIYGEYENQKYEQLVLSSSKEYSTIIMPLFTAIIGNCNKKLKLPLTNITPIFDCLFQGALQSDTSNLILSKTLAVIVNKWTDEQILESIHKTIQTRLLPMLKEEDDVHKRKLCFNIFIWLIKALVMRGHPYGFELLDSIIIEQCGTDIGEDAAISFTTLLEDDGFVLSKSSHANLSILYKQRVFNHCFNTLIRKSELNDLHYSNSQANYLLALLYLLQKVPRQVTIHELPKLMMPIIVSLSSHHMNLIILALKVTQDIIPNAQSIIVQHLGSFIHALLRLTCFPVVDIRLLALKGLLTLAQKGKSDILSPFRPSVVKELASALDDKKRIVRKQAVDCREKW